MHYLAPGKKNLIWHLVNVHGVAFFGKVTTPQLEQKHKEEHSKDGGN